MNDIATISAEFAWPLAIACALVVAFCLGVHAGLGVHRRARDEIASARAFGTTTSRATGTTERI